MAGGQGAAGVAACSARSPPSAHARPACLGKPSSRPQAQRLGLASPARRPCPPGPAQLPKRAGSSRAAQPGGDPTPQLSACSMQPPPTPRVALPSAGPLPPVRSAEWIRLSGAAGRLRASAAPAAGSGKARPRSLPRSLPRTPGRATLQPAGFCSEARAGQEARGSQSVFSSTLLYKRGRKKAKETSLGDKRRRKYGVQGVKGASHFGSPIWPSVLFDVPRVWGSLVDSGHVGGT